VTARRRRSIRSSGPPVVVATAVATVAALLLAACAGSVDVAVERADRIGASPGGRELSPAEPDPAASVAWDACDRFGIPDGPSAGRWECATIEAPMDPFAPGETTLDAVQLALTRHRATGDRRGVLVVNPGGPGASGLDAVWSLRSELPVELLEAYDVVSWDPRGVGSSTPSISCGPNPDLDDPVVMIECAAATGDLAAHLAAPYSAADLETIRLALGERTIDYLGYSYGTAIGAQYAARYPDGVGGFVLDGAVDPDAGGPDGEFFDGFPFYAADGTAAAAERFHELCDTTERCLPGSPSSRSVLDVLRTSVASLPTDAFDPEPATVDADTLDGVVDSALYDVRNWPLLTTALGDAWQTGGGDASTLAALAAVDPVIVTGDEPADAPAGDGPDDFEVANLVIYCADFAHVVDDTQYCDLLSRNEQPLTPVSAVDVARPILVIGTEYDPATPGYHAAEMAAALGDAFPLTWAGVGHTVFPGISDCVDDIVVAHLLDGVTPSGGPTCPFVDGVSSDAEIADVAFTLDPVDARAALSDVLLAAAPTGEDTVCVADQLARETTRVVTHVVLGVQSAEAVIAVDAARAAC